MSEDKNKVYIFDTTMRDGEQSPGASMSLEEKTQISRVFAEMGVDGLDLTVRPGGHIKPAEVKAQLPLGAGAARDGPRGWLWGGACP